MRVAQQHRCDDSIFERALSAPRCVAARAPSVVLNGWLQKRGNGGLLGSSDFRTCWFVLDMKGTVRYYKKPPNTASYVPPQGSFTLQAAMVRTIPTSAVDFVVRARTSIDPQPNKPFQNERELYIRAESSEDRDRWVGALRASASSTRSKSMLPPPDTEKLSTQLSRCHASSFVDHFARRGKMRQVVAAVLIAQRWRLSAIRRHDSTPKIDCCREGFDEPRPTCGWTAQSFFMMISLVENLVCIALFDKDTWSEPVIYATFLLVPALTLSAILLASRVSEALRSMVEMVSELAQAYLYSLFSGFAFVAIVAFGIMGGIQVLLLFLKLCRRSSSDSEDTSCQKYLDGMFILLVAAAATFLPLVCSDSCFGTGCDASMKHSPPLPPSPPPENPPTHLQYITAPFATVAIAVPDYVATHLVAPTLGLLAAGWFGVVQTSVLWCFEIIVAGNHDLLQSVSYQVAFGYLIGTGLIALALCLAFVVPAVVVAPFALVVSPGHALMLLFAAVARFVSVPCQGLLVIWSFVNITGGIWILRSTVTNERMVTGNDGSLQALARHNPISEPPARAVASASPECAHGRMVEANALL